MHVCTPPPPPAPHHHHIRGGGGGFRGGIILPWDISQFKFARNFPRNFQAVVRNKPATKSPRREVVRSSAGAGVVYPHFLGSFA